MNYHKLEEMLEDELEKISTSGKLTTTSLDLGDKTAHFLKSIKTIEAMDNAEDGYSSRGRMYRDDRMMVDDGRMSYARADMRGRGSNARRDSMGRYADSKSDLMMEIEELKRQVEKMED